jgi:hypothetical protein
MLDADDLWDIIEPQLASSQFYSICVSGQQGSGKTSVARELLAKAEELGGYTPLFSSGEDIATFALRAKAEAKGSKKVAILFDDMSYVMNMMSGKTQGATKSFIGKIRHYFKAKLFVIYNVHVFTGIPPIFRNTSEWIFSKPSMLEYETIMALSSKEAQEVEYAETMIRNVMDLQEVLRLRGEVTFKYNDNPYHFTLGTDEDHPNDGRLMLLMSNGTPYFYRAQLVNNKELKSYDMGRDVKVNTDVFLPRDEKKKGQQATQPATIDSEDEELEDEDLEEETQEEVEETQQEEVKEPEPAPKPIAKDVQKPKGEKVKPPKLKSDVPVTIDDKKVAMLKTMYPDLTDAQIREMMK